MHGVAGPVYGSPVLGATNGPSSGRFRAPSNGSTSRTEKSLNYTTNHEFKTYKSIFY